MREIKILKNVIYYECKKQELIMKQNKKSLNLKCYRIFCNKMLKKFIYYECKIHKIFIKPKS